MDMTKYDRAVPFSVLDGQAWQTLAEFTLTGAAAGERLAGEQVAVAVRALDLPAPDLDRLKRTLSKAIANAQENVTGLDRAAQMFIRVLLLKQPPIQSALPLGWGSFSIEKMVDGRAADLQAYYLVELCLYREGDKPNG